MSRPDIEPQPWRAIPLADYEGHMEAPQVGQAAMLRDILGEFVTRLRPASLALLGAAGGNGLECVEPGVVRRVVAVDINPDYLAACRELQQTEFGEERALAQELGRGR